MSPEAAEPGSATDWLRHARSDLAFAQVALPPNGLLEALCFHAQQAAEKAIKAVLVQEGFNAPRSHSIGALFEMLPEGVDVPGAVAAAAELTEFAVEARYPGAVEAVSDGEYAHAVALAHAVVRWAEERVSAAGDSP